MNTNMSFKACIAAASLGCGVEAVQMHNNLKKSGFIVLNNDKMQQEQKELKLEQACKNLNERLGLAQGVTDELYEEKLEDVVNNPEQLDVEVFGKFEKSDLSGLEDLMEQSDLFDLSSDSTADVDEPISIDPDCSAFLEKK
jgi:hypothetical protein